MNRDTFFSLHRGQLSAGETAEVLAHVEECADCQQRAAEVLGLAQLTRDLAADLLDDSADDEMQTSPRRVGPFLAASAAAAAAVIAFFFITRAPKPVVPQPKSAKVQPIAAPPKQLPVSQYGNASWDETVRNALASGMIDSPPEYRALQSAPDEFRNSGAMAAPGVKLEPNGAVVESLTPEFHWPAEKGTHSVVRISNRMHIVETSAELEGTTWQAAKPLARGLTYSWQVTRERDGVSDTIPAPPDPPARFTILSEPGATELQSARSRFPQDHVLIGVICARLGLRHQALEELKQAGADERIARLRKNIASW